MNSHAHYMQRSENAHLLIPSFQTDSFKLSVGWVVGKIVQIYGMSERNIRTCRVQWVKSGGEEEDLKIHKKDYCTKLISDQNQLDGTSSSSWCMLEESVVTAEPTAPDLGSSVPSVFIPRNVQEPAADETLMSIKAFQVPYCILCYGLVTAKADRVSGC